MDMVTPELSLTFSPMEKLKDYTLEIIVMDKDRIGRNECIGKVWQFPLSFNYQFTGYSWTQGQFTWATTLAWYDFQVNFYIWLNNEQNQLSPKLPSSQWHVLKLWLLLCNSFVHILLRIFDNNKKRNKTLSKLVLVGQRQNRFNLWFVCGHNLLTTSVDEW